MNWQDGKFQTTVDGVDYTVSVEKGGDVMFIHETSGQKIADAELDHAVEAIHYAWFNEEDGMLDSGCSSFHSFSDLAQAAQFAHWLIATHPEYG